MSLITLSPRFEEGLDFDLVVNDFDHVGAYSFSLSIVDSFHVRYFGQLYIYTVELTDTR